MREGGGREGEGEGGEGWRGRERGREGYVKERSIYNDVYRSPCDGGEIGRTEGLIVNEAASSQFIVYMYVAE